MTDTTPGLRARLQYKFDRTIAGGTGVLMFWLAVISVLMVALAAVLLTIGILPSDAEEGLSYPDSFWTTLNMALDPGAVDDPGWPYRMVMLGVAVLGVLIVSTIIGVLTSGIEGKLDDLRRGRSLVLEENHTIILGWSTKIAAAVQELVLANESERRAVIAVLADRDKVEMEEYFADRIEDLGPTEIICRSGDPCDLADLAIVRPERARSVILLAGDGPDGDALILKRSLALKRLSERTGRSCPVIAEVQDPENGAAVRRSGDVEVVEPAQLVTRVILQAARQPGLSMVYEELLSFAGCELYFHGDPTLVGNTYADAAMRMPRAAVVGIAPADGSTPVLTPPADRILAAGDELVLVAEDDSDIVGALDQPITVSKDGLRTPPELTPKPESYLVIGWHGWAPVLLRELDQHLASGSTIRIMYDPEATDGPDEVMLESLENVAVTCQTCRTTRYAELDAIDLSDTDEIIVLSYRDDLDAQLADSRTLLTLVHLRDIVERSDRHIGIATELLDAQNRALASRGRSDDFIASEELVSNVMVQLSENTRLGRVLEELLRAEGSELYLRPATHYVDPGRAVPFGALVASGLERDEAVIGIFQRHEDGAPPKLRMAIEKLDEVTLHEEDAVVVIADE